MTFAAETMKKQINRLAQIGALLNRYSHCWGENPSSRLAGWVDEYDDIKAGCPEAFAAYCQQRGLDRSHGGTDCVA